MQNHLKNNLDQFTKNNYQPRAMRPARPNNLAAFVLTEAGVVRQASQNVWLNHLIGDLPAAEIEILSAFGKRINLAAGQSIYRYGEPVDHFYFPETAIVSQYQMLEDGRSCEIAMIGDEGVVGMSATAAPLEASCWSEVSVAGSVLKISGEAFRRNLGNNSILQVRLQEFTNRYVGQLSQRVACNYFHQIKERFCSWLLMIAGRCRAKHFSFTQEAMARLLGVHRPSLSCIAKDLQQENLIAYTRGKIKILNKEKLESQACACYANCR